MTTKTIKLIAFILLLTHGVGHFQGVTASLGVKINKSNPSNSWLLQSFSNIFNSRICFVLFLLTGIIGIATALAFQGIFFSDSLWQPMAITTAISSTLCLIVFPNSFALAFNKAGAIAVNLLIYYSVLLNNHWPTAIFED